MQRNVQLWLKGLIAAVIGAFSNAAINVVADPDHFNFSKPGLLLLGKTAAVSALVALFMYLKQSPVPPAEDGK
jgi:hypothetical protein